MGDAGAEANKGILNNVKDSLTDFVSSTKDSIINNGVVNKGSEAITASTQIVSSAVSNISVENTKDAIMNAMSDSSSSFYFIIVLLVIAAIVCYILYYIITDTVINQQKILIPGTEMPIICTERRVFPFTQKLESGNGNKRTYCFWIYIFDINAANGSYKHVAHIAKKNADNDYQVTDSTIYIRLKKERNNLQVRFPLNKNDSTAVNYDSSDSDFMTDSNTSAVTGIEIEYIPLQRWVHVGIVINDIGGGTINVFIDGNYTKTENNQTIQDKNNVNIGRDYYKNTNYLNVSKLNLNNEGELIIGGDKVGSTAYGFSGLVSKFSIFNYDMNRNDIYKEYSAGPMKGVLASMGLTAYGIRNPIYKIKGSDALEQ